MFIKKLLLKNHRNAILLFMVDNSENIALIDSHCHLDFAEFDSDRYEVLESCHSKGITDIVIPGVLAENFENLIELCSRSNPATSNQHPRLHYAIGLHPVFLNDHLDTDVERIDHFLKTANPIAVGEIGLDFFVKKLDKHRQLDLFKAQLILAKKHELPVILHIRKAHDEALQLLSKHKVKGGIVHAFNGSIQQAYKYIELGFKLGFGGMLTYEHSTKLRALVKQIPTHAIVLETDSPDMTVQTHRGKRNSPEHLTYIIDILAMLTNTNKKQLSQDIYQNTLEILKIPNY